MRRLAWLTPEERKARKKARMAQYYARPEVKAHKKARMAAYCARPEVKARRLARMAEYCARPEVKAKVKARTAEYRARPEVKARRKAHQAEYCARPEVKARNKAYAKAWRYSLTIEAIQALLAAGCVAATIANASRCAGSLEIDHDHRCCDRYGSCGKCVRGALCLKHNKVLGGYEASVSWAGKYLARYQANQEGGGS